MQITKLVVLEYSPSQDSYHISFAEDLIINNLKVISQKVANDFKVIGIFKDRSSCDEAFALAVPAIEKLNMLKTVEIGTLTISDLLK
jgi:hypothetical protein